MTLAITVVSYVLTYLCGGVAGAVLTVLWIRSVFRATPSHHHSKEL